MSERRNVSGKIGLGRGERDLIEATRGYTSVKSETRASDVRDEEVSNETKNKKVAARNAKRRFLC